MLVWGVVIFVSVLVHEYGHALTSLAFGHSSEITLFALGGITTRKETSPLKTWQECLIIANGPIAGLLLAIASYYLFIYVKQLDYPLLTAFLNISFVVNLFWTVLNLFPVQPLDGGKLFMLVLNHFFGLGGIRISLIISMLFAVLAAILLFLGRSVIGGALFMMFAYESFRGLQELVKVSKEDQDEGIQGLMEEARSLERKGERADSLYEKVLSSTTGGMLHDEAAFKLAQSAYLKGEVDSAWNLIQNTINTPETMALKVRILMGKHDYEGAKSMGEALFRQVPSFEIAMQNAFASSLLNQPEAAVGWIARAQEMAKVPLEHLIRHAEFDPIRKSAPFRAFIAKNHPK